MISSLEAVAGIPSLANALIFPDWMKKKDD
jgi:hypothetical protein